MSRHVRIDRDLVKELYTKHRNVAEVVRQLNARGISAVYGTVKNIVKGRVHGARSRFTEEPVSDKNAKMPAISNPAIAEKRTLYPSTVIREFTRPLLKSGHHQRKIGREIIKGEWKGMPVFCLTLEERATCPTSCRHWRSCYGNNMHLAHRHSHEAPDFEERLIREVVSLGRIYPKGFVVRLHILGDFYSVRYVKIWGALLDKVPSLRVYGYTARDPNQDPIGVALADVAARSWDRFAMRFSNGPDDPTIATTISLEHPIQKPADAIICPAQMGQSENCGSCALCWGTRKRIAFLQH